MPKYTIILKKNITTKVDVIAKNAADARRYIENYGLIEAASDMSTDDTVTIRIQSVKLTAYGAHE